jgi:hypothetical protein
MNEEYLIKNTTKEEREQIVRDALGQCEAYCDGCASGYGYDLYQDYIDGKKEISEITMEFKRSFIKEEPEKENNGCNW